MARRIDENQPEIVKTFRQLGASVLILSNLGKGCPDICCGIFGKNYLFEIKNGKKPPSGQKLTEKESEFFESWKGQVKIITSTEQVIEFINSLRYK